MTPAPAVAILIGASRIRREIVTLTPDEEQKFIAELEAAGQWLVKYRLDRHEVPPGQIQLAAEWVSKKEREAALPGRDYRV
jgi:hypothetical protein